MYQKCSRSIADIHALSVVSVFSRQLQAKSSGEISVVRAYFLKFEAVSCSEKQLRDEVYAKLSGHSIINANKLETRPGKVISSC